MNRTYWKLLVMLLGCITLLSCSEQSTAEGTENVTDYALEENWMKIGTDTDYDVDIIYYYPTAYFPSKEYHGLYCPVDHAGMHETAYSYYDMQAKILEGVGNMYVPWYRQADASQLLGKDHDTMIELAREVPYEDVKASFDYYIKNYNQGKPFILTGHSQGAIVLKILLEDYMKEHPEVLERMVVAYPLGFSFEKSYFEKNPHLKFAEGESDTGVIASWNCERVEDGKFGAYNYVCFSGALAMNPVTWKHDYEAAPADDERFLGSANYPGLRPSVQVQYDPARNVEVLIIGVDTDEYDRHIIGDQNLHMMDFNLFTENIRENAQKRIEAFLQKK